MCKQQNKPGTQNSLEILILLFFCFDVQKHVILLSLETSKILNSKLIVLLQLNSLLKIEIKYSMIFIVLLVKHIISKVIIAWTVLQLLQAIRESILQVIVINYTNKHFRILTSNFFFLMLNKKN